MRLKCHEEESTNSSCSRAKEHIPQGRQRGWCHRWVFQVLQLPATPSCLWPDSVHHLRVTIQSCFKIVIHLSKLWPPVCKYNILSISLHRFWEEKTLKIAMNSRVLFKFPKVLANMHGLTDCAHRSITITSVIRNEMNGENPDLNDSIETQRDCVVQDSWQSCRRYGAQNVNFYCVDHFLKHRCVDVKQYARSSA